MSTRIANLTAFLKERLPSEIPPEDEESELPGLQHYLGFVAPAGDGSLIKSVLDAVPTLSVYAVGTEDGVAEVNFGSGPASTLAVVRDVKLRAYRNRVTVLFGDVPMALQRVQGRKFDLVILDEECFGDILGVTTVVRSEGLIIWRDKGEWWC